MVYVKCFIKKI